MRGGEVSKVLFVLSADDDGDGLIMSLIGR